MSKSKKRVYWVAGVLGVGGIAAVPLLLSFDVAAFVAAIAGNVGVLGTMGVLYQLLRDEAAHQKEVWLQRDDQLFQMGATSHIANTVFDRHVIFCEAYVAEVQATIETLTREHATKEALTHAFNLQALRRKHETWVTLKMSAQLTQFEAAVRKLGAQAHYANATIGREQHAEKRSKTIDEMFAGFEEVLPEMFSREGTDGISASSIIERVRCMLGINELVELRTRLVERAHKALSSQ